MIDAGTITAAADRIKRYVRSTPVLEYALPQADVALKLEMLQHTGSFKVRGAFNKLLTTDVPAAGVVAASGGNHGLAVAYAARSLGVSAEIFVPALISEAKLHRLESVGAQVTVAGDAYADALVASRERAESTGALPIHAYDDAAVVAGQGTTFSEFDAQAPHLDTLLVGVGGGGLIGGAGAWYGDRIRLIAVETEGTPTLHTALSAGRAVPVEVSGLAADSLGARTVGEIALSIARRSVAESLLVTDDEVRFAMRALWNDARLVTEPGGAVALAALLSGRYAPGAGERVGVLVCGANTDPATFGQLVAGP